MCQGWSSGNRRGLGTRLGNHQHFLLRAAQSLRGSLGHPWVTFKPDNPWMKTRNTSLPSILVGDAADGRENAAASRGFRPRGFHLPVPGGLVRSGVVRLPVRKPPRWLGGQLRSLGLPRRFPLKTPANWTSPKRATHPLGQEVT